MPFILKEPPFSLKGVPFSRIRIGESFCYFATNHDEFPDVLEVDTEEILIKTPDVFTENESKRNAVLAVSKDEIDLGCFYRLEDQTIVYPVTCYINKVTKHKERIHYEQEI